MFRQFITDPDAFMTERVSTRSAKIEILVVLLVGGMGMIGSLYLGLEVLDISDSDEMPLAVTAYIIRPLLFTLGLWIAYTVLLHFASRFFNARGRLRRLFTGFAWSFVPMGIGNLVQSIAMYLIMQDLAIEDHLEGASPTAQIDSVITVLMDDPIMIAASVVFLGTIAWSAYLMTYVLASAKTNLSHDEAVKLVAPITAIQIVLGAWAIVSGSPNFALLI